MCFEVSLGQKFRVVVDCWIKVIIYFLIIGCVFLNKIFNLFKKWKKELIKLQFSYQNVYYVVLIIDSQQFYNYVEKGKIMCVVLLKYKEKRMEGYLLKLYVMGLRVICFFFNFFGM